MEDNNFEPDIESIAHIAYDAMHAYSRTQQQEIVPSRWEALGEPEQREWLAYVKERIEDPKPVFYVPEEQYMTAGSVLFAAIVDSMKGILPKPRPPKTENLIE